MNACRPSVPSPAARRDRWRAVSIAAAFVSLTALAVAIPITTEPVQMIGLGEVQSTGFASDSRSVYAACTNGLIQRIDGETGAVTLIGERHWGQGTHEGFRVSESGRYVASEYLRNGSPPRRRLEIVDTVTGAVTYRLDASLDWTTFRPVSVGFADVSIPVVTDERSFMLQRAYPDAGAGRELRVDIGATFNAALGEVQWTFRTVDPETGTFPPELEAGFLPPNDATGGGEGHVSFRIRPRADIDPKVITHLHNSATIVFDVEAPLTTNQTTNTIGPVVIINSVIVN